MRLLPHVLDEECGVEVSSLLDLVLFPLRVVGVASPWLNRNVFILNFLFLDLLSLP